MGVARKKLRQAEKTVYAQRRGHYLSGSPVGAGMARAISRLALEKLERMERAKTARKEN